MGTMGMFQVNLEWTGQKCTLQMRKEYSLGRVCLDTYIFHEILSDFESHCTKLLLKV